MSCHLSGTVRTESKCSSHLYTMIILNLSCLSRIESQSWTWHYINIGVCKNKHINRLNYLNKEALIQVTWIVWNATFFSSMETHQWQSTNFPIRAWLLILFHPKAAQNWFSIIIYFRTEWGNPPVKCSGKQESKLRLVAGWFYFAVV